jgi:hypothetical protein
MSQNVEIVRGLHLPGDTDLVGVFGDDAQANAIAGLQLLSRPGGIHRVPRPSRGHRAHAWPEQG